MSCYLFSNEQVAVMNNSWMYEYNPNALVNGFKLNLRLSHKDNAEEIYAQVAKALSESLTKNGYALQDTPAENAYILQHAENNTEIMITFNDATVDVVGSMTSKE